MKTGRQFFLLPAILLIFSYTLFGQPKPITAKEYETLRKAALAKTEKKIRRETTADTQYVGGQLTRTMSLVQEYLPPDKSRWLFIETEAGETTTTELIYLGDVEYRKENGKAWVKRNLKGDNDENSVGLTARIEKATEEYFAGETTLDGATYKVLIKKTVNGKKTIFNQSEVWINREGLIHKTTSNIKITDANMVLSSIVTYDYKPKPFNIVAPIK